MKYIIVVPDGMADLPMPELNGRTPWQYAKTPNFDDLANDALVGASMTAPHGRYPGSDIANMTILGYDPIKYYTGRGPIEAVAMQVPLNPRAVAFRCSLVYTDGETMIDHSSGHITTEEATPMIQLIGEKLGGRQFGFYPGVQYRHIMAWRDGKADAKTTPPHTFLGQPLEGRWPEGDGAERLQQLMYDSLELLENHPVNVKRRDEGKMPGNMIWLWGQGYAPNMPNFLATHGVRGGIITAVDVVRGLGRATGMEIIDVPGATGYIDTNYVGKAQYALDALDRLDLVYVHIEAPDEAGHGGNLEHKLMSIEDIDKKVVGTLRAGMDKRKEEYRMLIIPDHKTPVAMRDHDQGPVPFLLFDSAKPHRASHFPFDERAVDEATTQVDDGTELMKMLLKP